MRPLSYVPFDISSPSSEVFLDKNENPFELPPGLMEEMRMAVSSISLNRYPDQNATALRRALSEYCGFPSECISVGNGGDEIIAYLMTAFVPEGGCVMTLSPSFSGYEFQTSAMRIRTRGVSLEYLDGTVALDGEKLIDSLSASSPDLVIIDRPNNPSGYSIPLDLLNEVAALTRGILVVDEAYAEFGGGTFVSTPEALPLNVFVLRTFSKAWGLAGLRVGWGISAPELRKMIEKVRSPFNVGVFPQEAARIALKYSEWMHARVGGISYTRERFIEEVNRIPGLTALQSNANFVLLHLECTQDLVMRTFRKKGVHARFPGMGALEEVPGTWVRISIGLEEEMKVVLDALKELSLTL